MTPGGTIRGADALALAQSVVAAGRIVGGPHSYSSPGLVRLPWSALRRGIHASPGRSGAGVFGLVLRGLAAQWPPAVARLVLGYN